MLKYENIEIILIWKSELQNNNSFNIIFLFFYKIGFLYKFYWNILEFTQIQEDKKL